MVFETTGIVAMNKSISPTQAMLDVTRKSSKSPKSDSPASSIKKQRKKSEMKSDSSAEQRARVSDNLKKNIAKELKAPKVCPPARTSSSMSKDKKERKKKKKKCISETSLNKRAVLKGQLSSVSDHPSSRARNSTFQSFESSGKKTIKRRSSTKQALQDAAKAVADFVEKNNILDSGNRKPKRRSGTRYSVLESVKGLNAIEEKRRSLESNSPQPKRRSSSKKTLLEAANAAAEFYEMTNGSESGTQKTKRRRNIKKILSEGADAVAVADDDENSKISESKTNTDNGTSKKDKKQTEESTSNKGPKEDNAPLGDEDFLLLTTSPVSSGPKHLPTKGLRLLSFESIHGKSIHKPKSRRGSMNNGDGSEPQIGSLAPDSPLQSHGTLSSPGLGNGAGKKSSVLKAKREKQLLKQKQEQEEKELKTGKATLPAQKKKEDDDTHEVLDIVAASNHKPKTKAIFEDNDPDECSSQSSSCSIVSDGSFEKDDLLSHASDHSRDEKGLKQDLFEIEDGDEFLIDVESPSKFSIGEPSNAVDESFKSTLMDAMASSMSALTELEEFEEIEDSPKPSPPTHPSSKDNKAPPKTSLKLPTSGSSGKAAAPLRLVPKRAKSDTTSLKSVGTMANNILRIRLPGKRKSIIRQRTLSFNEKVRVKRVPCQAQVAGGDISNLWFQPQEYEAIKRKTMALIRAVQDDQTGGVTYCTRGLERYFTVDDVQEKRNDAWDSVLDEQEAQRVNNEAFNPDRLSIAYSATTVGSAENAMERGKLDEDAIARYTKKMRQSLRRTISMPV